VTARGHFDDDKEKHFGDIKRTLWRQASKWPLICDAFREHFGNKQT